MDTVHGVTVAALSNVYVGYSTLTTCITSSFGDFGHISWCYGRGVLQCMCELFGYGGSSHFGSNRLGSRALRSSSPSCKGTSGFFAVSAWGLRWSLGKARGLVSLQRVGGSQEGVSLLPRMITHPDSVSTRSLLGLSAGPAPAVHDAADETDVEVSSDDESLSRAPFWPFYSSTRTEPFYCNTWTGSGPGSCFW